MCQFEVPQLFVEGVPIIAVSPKYPANVRGCVVLRYRLIEKPDADGRALVANEIAPLYVDDGIPIELVESAQQALGKWLFTSRSHPEYSAAEFYAVFRFPREE